MERKNYWGFSKSDRLAFRDAVGSQCLFGNGECPRPNTGKVNHISGSLEARLNKMDKEAITDIWQNGSMECELHELMHDIREQEHIVYLRNEKI